MEREGKEKRKLISSWNQIGIIANCTFLVANVKFAMCYPERRYAGPSTRRLVKIIPNFSSHWCKNHAGRNHRLIPSIHSGVSYILQLYSYNYSDKTLRASSISSFFLVVFNRKARRLILMEKENSPRNHISVEFLSPIIWGSPKDWSPIISLYLGKSRPLYYIYANFPFVWRCIRNGKRA